MNSRRVGTNKYIVDITRELDELEASYRDAKERQEIVTKQEEHISQIIDEEKLEIENMLNEIHNKVTIDPDTKVPDEFKEKHFNFLNDYENLHDLLTKGYRADITNVEQIKSEFRNFMISFNDIEQTAERPKNIMQTYQKFIEMKREKYQQINACEIKRNENLKRKLQGLLWFRNQMDSCKGDASHMKQVMEVVSLEEEKLEKEKQRLDELINILEDSELQAAVENVYQTRKTLSDRGDEEHAAIFDMIVKGAIKSTVFVDEKEQ